MKRKKPRNLAARSPLLRKGGAHQPSPVKERRAGRRAVAEEIRETFTDKKDE